MGPTLTPLERKLSTIEAHWSHLQESFRELPLPDAAQLTIKPTWTSDIGLAVVTGPSAETVNRERGGRVSVHPLLLAADTTYWFSWRERWDYVAGSKSPWRFRESGITIFEGRVSTPEKIQLFRIEWPGVALWRAGTLGWQAPGAGHPHWQFDALRELEERFNRQREVDAIEQQLSLDEEAEEFNEATLAAVAEQPPPHAWTQMHFAAQARWSEQGWNGDIKQVEAHAHAPADEKQIRRWLLAAILYTRHEIER